MPKIWQQNTGSILPSGRTMWATLCSTNLSLNIITTPLQHLDIAADRRHTNMCMIYLTAIVCTATNNATRPIPIKQKVLTLKNRCNMNSNYATIDLEGWLKEQVRCVNEAIKELEKSQNYGKATLCEGMKQAYMQCLEKLNT